MPDHRSFPVPKAADGPGDKASRALGGNTDAIQNNSCPWGPATNRADSDHHRREFNAESDFATLLEASRIRANAARLGRAVASGKSKLANVPAAATPGAERVANISISDVGGRTEPSNRRKNISARAGGGTQASNRFDNVKNASKPNSGAKSDGGKGRW